MSRTIDNQAEAIEMIRAMRDDFVSGHDPEGLSLDSRLMYLTEGVGKLARQIRHGDAEQALVFASGVGAVAFDLVLALMDMGAGDGEGEESLDDWERGAAREREGEKRWDE